MMQEVGAGLCGSCGHARTITTRRGSTFLLCGLSAHDPRYPRYPRLPVRTCAGWSPATDAAAKQ